MRKSFILILSFFPTGLLFSHDLQDDCYRAFSNQEELKQIYVSAVDEIREKSLVVPDDISSATVAKELFTNLKEFNDCKLNRSRIFVAKNKAGKKVIIKILKKEHLKEWQNLILYETYLTKFYREKGIDVPAVLTSDYSRGILVKEYEHGVDLIDLTKRYIEKFPGIKIREVQRLLIKEIRKINKIHQGFAAWLEKRGVKYQEWGEPLTRLVLANSDLKSADFLYSFTKNRLVLIDP